MDSLHEELLGLRKRIAELAGVSGLETECDETAAQFYSRASKLRVPRVGRISNAPAPQHTTHAGRPAPAPTGIPGRPWASPPRRQPIGSSPSRSLPMRAPTQQPPQTAMLAVVFLVLVFIGAAAWAGIGSPLVFSFTDDHEKTTVGVEAVPLTSSNRSDSRDILSLGPDRPCHVGNASDRIAAAQPVDLPRGWSGVLYTHELLGHCGVEVDALACGKSAFLLVPDCFRQP
jgi:hypothetical protein